MKIIVLGHYSAGFTLDTYAHVTTTAQKQASNTMDSVLSLAVQSWPLRSPVWVTVWVKTKNHHLQRNRKKPWNPTVPRLLLVAGTGFEPATSGLWAAVRRSSPWFSTLSGRFYYETSPESEGLMLLSPSADFLLWVKTWVNEKMLNISSKNIATHEKDLKIKRAKLQKL